MALETTEITDQIYTSSEFESGDITRIKELGFGAVVDLRQEASDSGELIRNAGLGFLHVGITDHENPEIGQLEEVWGFTDAFLDRGEKVLIHCRAGTGRAPMAAISILAHRGMDYNGAVDFVIRKHGNTGFSEVQERFMRGKLAEYFRK